MIVTSEYIFLNPELNRINDNKEKTREKHECKYGFSGDGVKIKLNVKLLDKIKKTKQRILQLKV